MGYAHPMHPYLDHALPLAIAHRGASAIAPENTLRAFAAAVDLGYHYVETDVHATADGVLVAFHDPNLDRLTDLSGAIEFHPLASVRAALVGGSEQIPLLDEVLESWPDLRINIDPKSDRAADLLIRALRRHAALERVCVGSFVIRRLREMRRVFGPALCTSAAPSEALRARVASLGPALGWGAADCLQVPPRRGPVPIVDARLLTWAHARALQVHVWTINSRREMRRLLALGVDAIMSDRVVLLRELLLQRGQWTGSAAG
jgi:glycerophosphoryl diester phosphodiesterase